MNLILAILLSPLLIGVVSRTKALFAGRRGTPLLQPYYDLIRLLKKGAVYSTTTTWIFQMGPIVGLAATVLALAIIPLGGVPSLVSFDGDLLFVVYLFGVVRFLTVLTALDTGSSFEGMGASREVQFSALAEPTLLLALLSLSRITGRWSLSDMLVSLDSSIPALFWGAIILSAISLLTVFLLENARIPFDDPNTHLELTMIHEVMVLDHSGPDLAIIELSSALKFWALGSILVGVAIPIRTGNAWIDGPISICGLFFLSITVGVVESTMARFRLLRIPNILVGAMAFSVIALFIIFVGGINR